jgi:hypothetical protein
MRAVGIKTYRPESIGQRMDWRLPNKALAHVWGQRKDYVARLRWILGAGKAKWDSRRKATSSDRAYLRALAAERERAAVAKAEAVSLAARRSGIMPRSVP